MCEFGIIACGWVQKEDVADAKQQRRHISLVVRVLNPCLLVCQNDLSTWIEYAMQMERRLSPSTTGFDDDFSSSNYSQDGSNGSRESSPSKVAAATANATAHTDVYSFSVSAEINTLQSRLMTLDSRDIYVGIDLITFNANNVS
ncbi:unnamed protein product [Anisakis simplex]|uniref:Uncharacterized protein n=1 Tax=Anisakis simplex TaxID=6269 RepID=A0A3P6P0F4_ANISI|nr:unnamed protein product [Anisakis simplex]